MSQMAPMSWVLLMLIFVMSFMIFNSLNCFNFKYTPKTIDFKKIKKTMNWKW